MRFFSNKSCVYIFLSYFILNINEHYMGSIMISIELSMLSIYISIFNSSCLQINRTRTRTHTYKRIIITFIHTYIGIYSK